MPAAPTLHQAIMLITTGPPFPRVRGQTRTAVLPPWGRVLYPLSYTHRRLT